MATAANFLISSSPAIFAGKTHQQQLISLPLKPIKLNLSYSFKSLSLQRKNPSRIVTFVAEEDNTLVIQQDDEEVSWGNETEETEVVAGAGETEPEGFSEPPEDAKIFVGNLPYDVDSEQLAQLFQQAGVVEISEVVFFVCVCVCKFHKLGYLFFDLFW